MTLTPRQQELMILLCAEVKNHRFAPSYAQLGAALGIKSKHGVSNLLDIFQRAGLLKRSSKARSLELLASEYYHSADCICDGCAEALYLSRLKLIHALEVSPPISLAPKLRGLKPVGKLTAVYWRCGFPAKVRPQPRKVAL